MLVLNIKEKLIKKGKSKYWLQQQVNMTYQNLNNMIENRTRSIKYDVLEKMSEIFNCSIDDLFDKS